MNLLLLHNQAFAIALEWTGNSNSLLWSESGNWKGGDKLPNEDDEEVKFKKDLNNGEVIDLGGNIYTIDKLTVENEGNFTLANGTLNFDGEFKVKDGSIINVEISRTGVGKYKIEDAGSRLIINNSNALGDNHGTGGEIKIKKGGVLEFGESIESQTINNDIKIEDGGGRIEGNANLTIAGSLTDGGKKDGTLIFDNIGITRLSGNNSGYERDVTVASGSLFVDSGTGSGSVFIDQAALLGGSGLIGGDLFVDGTLDMSDGLGFGGDVGFGNNANIQLALGSSTTDGLLSGLAGASGLDTSILTLILGDGFAYGTNYNIFGDTSIVLSDFESIRVIDSNNNPLNVIVRNPSNGAEGIEIVVPELKSAALILGLFGLGVTQFRRKHRKVA